MTTTDMHKASIELQATTNSSVCLHSIHTYEWIKAIDFTGIIAFNA